MKNQVMTQLISLAEPKYQEFSSKLLPEIDYILGVRLPKLRKIARQIAVGNWHEYLKVAPDYFEEVMLQGMVIGYVQIDFNEKMALIADFIPKINNWSVCDSFCNGLKITAKKQSEMWQFLKRYWKDDREYQVRFAVVMLLDYYIDEKYIHKVLEVLSSIHNDGYYAKMAVAWAVSVCFVKFPTETMFFLQNNNLDDFTYNKSLQKIVESLKISKETKVIIRAMKR